MARRGVAGAVPGLISAFATPTFGRAEEREHVLSQVSDPAVRLVSLTGRSGVGKTHLALDIARSLGRDARERVTVVALADHSDPALVLPAIAAAFDLAPLRNVDVDEALARHIGTDVLVLVLDNFEHVLAAAPALGALLDRCPGVSALVTTQAPLRLRHEHVVQLAALPPPPTTVGDPLALLDEPAVAIYCERAAAVDQHFALTPANAQTIAQLCARLEGLPLAIALVATRAATLPASEILARLDADVLHLVRRPSADAPARHHDLASAIDWTYRLLSPAQQQLLRTLSVVAGSFDIDTADALDNADFGDVVDALGALVDFHLVDPVPDTEPARFVIPSSIRAFAAVRLREAGERDAVRRCYVSWRAQQARDLSPRAEFVATGRSLATRARVQEDLLHGLADAVDLELVDEALDLLCGVAPGWGSHGYYAPHERLVDEALALAAKHDVRSAAYANALSWSASLGLRQIVVTDSSVFVDQLRKAEALARELRDDDALLRALSFWLRISPVTGDLPEAARAAAEGIAFADGAGRRHWLAPFQVWSGMLAHQSGDDARAVELGREALRLARSTGDLRTIVFATMLLQPLATKFPEIAPEVPRTSEALALARATGFERLEAALLPMLVVEAVEQGDEATAVQWSNEAFVFARAIVDSPSVCFTFVAAAALAAMRDDHETGAFFHGLASDTLPSLSPTMPPESIAAHARVLERLEAALGTDAYMRSVERGAQTTWPEGVEYGLRYARDAAVAAKPPELLAEPEPPSLTARQREVLELLASGLSNKEIASRIQVSPKTVMHHALAIYRTLGVRSRSEATAWAFRSGLAH